MLPFSRDRHKGLLPIGGTTPLDRIVEELCDADLDALTVVTGHRGDEVQAHLQDEHPSAPLNFVRNHRYAETNNIVSLRLALSEVASGEDLLLIECDLLLTQGTLTRLALAPLDNVALVDRFRTGMDGTVVSMRDGRITAIHPPDCQPEGFDYRDTFKTLNVYRFSAETLDDVLRPLFTAGGEDGAFYEAVLARVPDLPGLDMAGQLVPPGSWAEIDDPVDLQAARFAFAPEERSRILAQSHGGRWNFELLDFSFMVNARFPTPAMHAAMRHAAADLVGSYGSSQTVLDEKLSWLLGCPPDRLVTLAGASQAFPLLRRAWSGARLAIPAPTFGEYARAFPDALRYDDRPGPGVNVEALDALADEVDVLVVVNPNNPTGTTVSATALHELATRRPATRFLVDESFAAFASGPPVRDLLEAAPLPNVTVLASLGKALGVTGMRLGYLYSHDRHLLDTIASELPVWNLSSQAEHLLELALKARPELLRALQQTRDDREALRSRLIALPGVRVVHASGGNFVLVELDGPSRTAAALCEHLLVQEAIAIKDVTDRFPDGVPRIRLGVRRHSDNDRLVTALARALPALAPASRSS